MKVTIHQSLCGENNKAWDLLKTTLPDTTLAKSITFKADLQEQTGDISWVPAIRGFEEGEYFLIMKTFEDTSPEVRRGRKFSHVMMIRLVDIVEVENLGPILELLPNKIDKEAVIEPITLELSKPPTGLAQASASFSGRFSKLISGFLNLQDYENTLIWCGQQDFDSAVIELWRRLDPAERYNFNFGISFNNDGIDNRKFNLIAIPENVLSKFLRSGFFIINQNDQHIPTELAEQILTGDQNAQCRLDRFKSVLGIKKTLSKVDIGVLAKGITSFEKLDSVTDLKKINTLSHIIGQYAPSESQGAEYKSQLLHRIVNLMQKKNYSDLIVLRNFKTESFKDSTKMLSRALLDWVKLHILSETDNKVPYSEFFNQQTGSASNWWNMTITNGLKSFLSLMDKAKVSVVYNWLTEDPSILSQVSNYIDKSLNAESCFLEKLPEKVSQQLFEELKLVSIKMSWYRLYAKLLRQRLPFNQAVTELLSVVQNEDAFEALDIILKDANPKSVVSFAINSGDIRMIKSAGLLASKKSYLLSPIDVLNLNWQRLWLEAMKNGNKLDTGLIEPELQITKIFEALIQGIPILEELLHQISLSEYGNVLAYHNRTELWAKLPLSEKEAFLKKTSTMLLELLSKNSTTPIPQDKVLAEYITSTGISDFLYFNRNNIKSVIPIFEEFSQLSDFNLKEYLQNYSESINAIESKQLGILIRNKKFANSAYEVYRKATKNNNWRFALAECHQLLDLITKGILSLSGIISTVNIPTDQWWQGAEELIIELYPNSSSLTTIWRKAGGNEADLLMHTTPNVAWRDVLHKLRYNGFKGISMNNLLKEIKKQYGSNEKFEIIYSLRKNFIKT